MKKNLVLILALIIIAVLAVMGYQRVSQKSATTTEEETEEESAWKEEAGDYNIAVVFKPYQYGQKKECKGIWHEGMTAYEATLECGKAANLNIKTIYDPKIHKANLIDEVMGIKNGEHNSYWLYYVNGKFITNKQTALLEERKSEPMPEKFYLRPDDRVEWRFEEWVTLEEEHKTEEKTQ